ncbi:uncharacterized protein KQ657_004380 [Scheffersomyces spartinae]|uniref:Protein CMS1 n=1 Tax=Scheffersomyces spartinae TaxID=45513 RepID=A0A9P7VBF0_9ASCO|nr:uncharacterized protein KQ657_004380 [Scheffersomyces spartinae]KAG7194703.1 hypothetical protein KQ657_004380 [Scheffersomyces spartinae]
MAVKSEGKGKGEATAKGKAEAEVAKGMANPVEADDLDDGLDYQIDYSEDENGAESDVEPDPESKPGAESSNKKRKLKSSKLQDKKRLKMEIDMKRKKDIARESSVDSICDYINSKIRSKNPDLSALELSSLYVDKNTLRTTSDFEDPRTLDNLESFITARFKNMIPHTKQHKKQKKKNKKNDDDQDERKFIVVMSMSAIRACDVHRATKDLGGSSLKVINKNKLAVDLKLLTTTHSRVLCCTPGRLLKVLNAPESPLKPNEIKIIIMDNTYLDSKLQNVWDIKETLEAVNQLAKTGSKVYLY